MRPGGAISRHHRRGHGHPRRAGPIAPGLSPLSGTNDQAVEDRRPHSFMQAGHEYPESFACPRRAPEGIARRPFRAPRPVALPGLHRPPRPGTHTPFPRPQIGPLVPHLPTAPRAGPPPWRRVSRPNPVPTARALANEAAVHSCPVWYDSRIQTRLPAPSLIDTGACARIHVRREQADDRFAEPDTCTDTREEVMADPPGDGASRGRYSVGDRAVRRLRRYAPAIELLQPDREM